MPSNRFKKNLHWFAISLTLIMFSGCGVYSFTGASVPPEAQTISVQYFPNKAQLVEPILSPTFTDALRDQFTGQTNLEMIERNGDLAIEGEIIDYKTSPVAIQGDQTAALNRVSVTVNVRFVNVYEPDKNFEQKFTQFLDYNSDDNYDEIKETLLIGINEMLTTDIFNKAVINW